MDAPHLETGAGDVGLIVQFCMGVVAVIVGVTWVFVEAGRFRKLGVIMVIVLTPALFLFTARGLQRFPPSYSDNRFEELVQLHESGSNVESADVVAKLGSPLLHESWPNGGQCWLYSYMPSCGFGWDRKFVMLDGAGKVTQIYTSIEP